MRPTEINALNKRTVITIHEDQLKRHGGLPGVRDEGALESSLAQPFAGFGGVELYPSLVEKAARYGFGIIKNHPFNDGNKRTGAALIITFLRGNGITFKPRWRDFYHIIIGVADGSVSYDELVKWVREQCQGIAGN